MTGTRDFYLMALGSLGIPPLQVRIDGSIFRRDQHPTRFAPPRRCRDDGFEIVSRVEHLRSRHESRLLSTKVGCEVLMKLRGIQVGETVCRLLYRSRRAEVTWKRFPLSASLSPASGMWAAM